MKFDQVQFDTLLDVLRSGSPAFTIGNVVAIVAALIASASLVVSYVIVKQQRAIERRRYVADLHRIWWDNDLDTKRHIVWRELEKWKEFGDLSPAIKHYSKASDVWSLDSPERVAHARVLFFFSDLNRLIEHGIVDEDLAFELFGTAQYGWFRPYIAAIRGAVKNREGNGERLPRWVIETELLERRLDQWETRAIMKARSA